MMNPVFVNVKGTFGLGNDKANAALVSKTNIHLGEFGYFKDTVIPNLTRTGQIPFTGIAGVTESNGILMPGLKDSHAHPVLYSIIESLNPIGIFGLRTKQEILSKIQSEIDSRKDKGLVLVYGLNTTLVQDLTRADLDAIESRIPIVVYDPSYHGAVVNSKGLALISQIAEQKEIELGKKLSGSKGPDGKLTEDYVFLGFELMDSILGKTVDEAAEKISKLIVTYLQDMLKRGITSCNDMFISTPTQLFAIFLASNRWEQFTETAFPVDKIYLRPDLFLLLSRNESKYKDILFILRQWIIKDKVGLKLFADGSFGSYTANLSYDYLDVNTSGICVDTHEKCLAAFEAMKLFGINDLRIHAIGDVGILHALNVISLAKKSINPDLRAGIEHFELSGYYPLIVSMAKKLGIEVCMQPGFSTDYIDYEPRLGPDRISSLNPIRSVLKSGIPLTLGTDGMPNSMLFALWAAINHPNPDQSLTISKLLQVGRDPNDSNLILVSEEGFNRIVKRMDDPDQIRLALKYAWDFGAELNRSVLRTIYNGTLVGQ